MEQIFNTLYDSAPFSAFSDENYKNAIVQAVAEARAEIEEIISEKSAPSFENTIEKLAYSGEKLDRISSIFFNIHNAETNAVLQKQAQEISPILSDFQNDIYLNEALFKRVKQVYEQYSPATNEERMLLEKTYKNFVRNGANLSNVNKEILRNIDKELALKSLQFSQNILAQTNDYQLFISEEEEIKGLPDFVKEPAQELAKKQNKKGWIFTLNAPSFVPFLTYCENRKLRKELFLANAQKCFNGEKNNNSQLVIDLVNLRQQRANLLGYNTYSDFVLEERMAQTPTQVTDFLHELLYKAKPSALAQLEELKDFAYQRDQIIDFNKWDTAFYSEKLRKERFNIDDQALKPYFKLENVLSGIFTIAQKLYGIHFQEITNIETYHNEVKTFKVTDDEGNYLAIFYTDFHPRAGKRNGAWMTSFKNQYKKNGKNSRPHISIVCNFTRPTETLPSLLTFNEVTTLFHEFGHALHGILADTTYPNLSGTSVYWDFVELPSQLMENWCYEKQALELFAHHYQTGEVISMEYIEKIKQASAFMEGLQTLRQLSFGLLDMAWHQNPTVSLSELKSFEEKVISESEIYPKIEEDVCISTSFSHIFAGGYASGYYSYKWAEVLDADAFELFTERGIFDSKTATDFKKYILSKGGSEPPMELYVHFRGKKPSVSALLKRANLMK